MKKKILKLLIAIFMPKKHNVLYFLKFGFLLYLLLNYSSLIWIFQNPILAIKYFIKLDFNTVVNSYIYKINDIGKNWNENFNIASPDELYEMHDKGLEELREELSDTQKFYFKIAGGLIILIVWGVIYYNYKNNGNSLGGNTINNTPPVEKEYVKAKIISTGVYTRKFFEVAHKVCHPFLTKTFLKLKLEYLMRKVKGLQKGTREGMTADELANYVDPFYLEDLKILAKKVGFHEMDSIAYQVLVLKTGNCVMESVGNFVFENGYNFEILADEFNKAISSGVESSSDLSFRRRIPKIFEAAIQFLESNEWCVMTKSQVKAKMYYILHYAGKKN